MTLHKADIKKMLLLGLITFITGQVYYYPFGTDFRFAFSPITFAFLLMYFPDVSIVPFTVAVGLSVFSGRFMLEYFGQNTEVADIVAKHFPGGMYYIFYGLLFYFLDVRTHSENPLIIIVLLTVIDSVSNMVELAIRNQIFDDMSTTISSLLILALSRSFIAVSGYWSIKLYNVLILKKAHYSRYLDLLIFISNLKAELFYLKKSAQDIEKAMENSYSMYMDINTLPETIDSNRLNPYKSKALTLARDIHEIKKDYQRVITGIEKLLPDPGINQKMSISDIFGIIKDNSSRYIDHLGKNTKLSFSIEDNLYIAEYYSLVSILNNLIINAIDATGDKGEIKVRQYSRDGIMMIEVSDNGSGIPENNLDVIFEPGFSTKYNKLTGAMSTGLGLTHVKSMIEHLSGEISVASTVGMGTVFTIGIPNKKLGKGE
jgi:two-component system sensor histidine kinase YcbA